MKDPIPFKIPEIDLSQKTNRHVVVAQGTVDSYKGHPTTLLMPDGKTMYCVYPLGHGGPSAVLQRSDDGGVSWSPFEENGLLSVMPFTTIIEISGKRLLGSWSREGITLLSISDDGGLTWGSERLLFESGGAFPKSKPCEPAFVRSPDCGEIACILRVSSNLKWRSLAVFSRDDGDTWTSPVELDRTMTGNRHQARYASDGRLVIAFRDRTANSPTWGHFVAWVGRYDDLRNAREGQYRIKLLHSYDKIKPHDCGYSGLELLPDDTFVATTYVKYRQDRKNSPW